MSQQGLAKQSIHSMNKELDSTAVIYSEADLIRFGNFLFNFYGVMVYPTDGNNKPAYERTVTHADTENWKAIDTPLYKGPRFTDGSSVVFCMQLPDERNVAFTAKVLAVKSYPGKHKYDIEVTTLRGTERMYNISEFLLVPANT